MTELDDELTSVAARYARRGSPALDGRYSLLNPAVYMSEQERERALIRTLSRHAPGPLQDMRLLEVGCGYGNNLLRLIQLGFKPENMIGNDLLPERAAAARHVVPTSCRILEGDARELSFGEGAFDIVYQSTVFSSLLDNRFQEQLASHMWRWVKPGGGALWYDFIYDNPSNPDVRGVPVKRIRELFPDAMVSVMRVTLAPPISRRVCRVHPSAYQVLNWVPWFRTHVLCWIGKRRSAAGSDPARG